MMYSVETTVITRCTIGMVMHTRAAPGENTRPASGGLYCSTSYESRGISTALEYGMANSANVRKHPSAKLRSPSTRRLTIGLSAVSLLSDPAQQPNRRTVHPSQWAALAPAPRDVRRSNRKATGTMQNAAMAQ